MWLPDLAISTIHVAAPSAASALALPSDARILADRTLIGGHYLIVALGRQRYRLWITAATSLSAPQLTLPFDRSTLARLAAVTAFMRACSEADGPIPESFRASPFRTHRLTLLLRVIDASSRGASLRDIAYSFIFPRHTPLAGAAWKGSSERRHAQRLLAAGRQLVEGGYRALLAG